MKKNLILVLAAAVLGWLLGAKGVFTQGGAERSDQPSVPGAEGPAQMLTKQSKVDVDGSLGTTVDIEEKSLNAFAGEGKIERIRQLNRAPSLRNSIEMLELIVGMSETEIQSALSELSGQGMRSFSDFMLPHHLFTAWVEKNPTRAHAFFQDESNRMQQGVYGQALFSAWAARDASGALAAAHLVEDRQQKAQAINAIAGTVAGSDPARAYGILADSDDSQPWSYQSVFMLWAEHDLDTAMAEIAALPAGEVRMNALAGVINGVATRDFDRAASMAIALERNDERERAIQSILHTWVDRDAAGAMRFLAELEPGASKNTIIQSSIWMLGRSDPKAALDFVQENMTGRARDNALSRVIGELAKENPLEASRLVEAMPYGRGFADSVREVAQQWGKEQPIAAMQWARSLPDGVEKEQAVNQILNGYAREKTNEAKIYLQSMPDGEERSYLASRIARQLSAENPRQAIEWTRSLADATLSSQAYDEVIRGWASEAPRAALAHLQAQGEVEAIEKNARVIAEVWARTDVKAAAEWALSLEGKGQSDAINRVAQEWLDHNTEEASVWIAGLEASEGRDQAVGNLVQKVYRSDPEAAFVWAETIGNERSRFNFARRTISEMNRSGQSEQAEQLIRSSSFEAGEKTRLLKVLEWSKARVP